MHPHKSTMQIRNMSSKITGNLFFDRFGHTLIQGMLDLVEEVHYDRKKTDMVSLSDVFFNPALIYKPGVLDKVLVGLATQARQKFDNLFSEQVTNHLFQQKNSSFGMDLVALNLQRGRDHGLPGNSLKVKVTQSL